MRTEMMKILAYLRMMQWIYQTNHWQVIGEASYGDHLLFQRLYEGMGKEVDMMAEKLVGYFGNDAVGPSEQMTISFNYMAKFLDHTCLFKRSLDMEENLQVLLEKFYRDNKDHLSLGIDDFIMGLASDHEENIYLLRQRLKK